MNPYWKQMLEKHQEKIRRIRIQETEQAFQDANQRGASNVYVIHAIGTNRYKVGLSKTPQKRLMELQTGCPMPLEIITTVRISNPERWERKIHEKLSDHSVIGEWFELDEDRLAQLMRGLEILRVKWGIRKSKHKPKRQIKNR